MSLTVAIDVTTALVQRGGVGRYTRELVYALGELPAPAPRLRPFFVAPRAEYPLGRGIEPAAVPRGVRSWRWEMLLRHLARRPAHGPWDGADLYHAPDVVFPPVRRIPVVMTVHDLSYVVYPRFHTRLNGTYLRTVTPLMARSATLIIADSESTRRDLLAYTGVPERKVRVVHLGVAEIFRDRPTPERIAAARARYRLDDEFILSVGTLEPRKNLAGTLRAYRLLHERLPDAPLLALVGGAGWGLDEQRLLPRGRLADRVRRLGLVPDDDLAALYASCCAFAYPSYYEGWGLPVAEALALGAPVVTSEVSSLPEITGDAALLVDPRRPDAIAEAIERILTDGATVARLRRDGPRQVQQFTRAAWAAATAQVYQETMAA